MQSEGRFQAYWRHHRPTAHAGCGGRPLDLDAGLRMAACEAVARHDGHFATEGEGLGTRYATRRLHRGEEHRKHEDMGFFEGWDIMLQQMEEAERSLP